MNAANDAMHEKFNLKGRVMGSPINGWIAVDYTDFVLHIFSPDQRDYYKLEELWTNGKILLKVK